MWSGTPYVFKNLPQFVVIHTIKAFRIVNEAEEIKRWQECTEELYQKGINDPGEHHGVVIQLELDILECEVSRPQKALLQTKLVQVMEFQLRYLKP